MIDLKRYAALKDEAEKLRREADRSEGELRQLMGRLRTEFGCESIEEAKTELESLAVQQEKAEEEFNQLLGEFEEEWGERLEG